MHDKELLALIRERCANEADFESWKQKFLAEEYEKVKDEKFVTCTYMISGTHPDEGTVREADLEDFISWLNESEPGCYQGSQVATKEEVQQYIALHCIPEFYDYVG